MAPNSKIVTVINSHSPYFKSKGKVLSLLPDEEVEVFLFQEEIIVVLKLNDVNLNSQIFIPQSRKDFYEFMQKATTSRGDIQKTIQELIQKSLITFNSGYSEKELLELIKNETKDKSQLVEEFRNLRDLQKIDFQLINSKPRPLPKFNPKKRHFKKNYRPF